ncbi:transcriptional regulator [Burkholderia sp. THE68]|uniref:sugar diacid recognition domain-containing protein n=1 Tax=Burkholderia sp. THE68 TaxID=758782 RepID=UPI0013184127|nr:sugar diacid recognition domain-containing protein [Burkholderia sp. THE68]BBU30372.1 transcriptional regulator [Burkholderia sp. THE68]
MSSQIDSRLAAEIVERATSVLPFDVNVMDAHGSVIASTDPMRIGTLHSGAQLVLANNRDVEIDTEMAKRLPQVKPGINLPLHANGYLCGVLGITGEPSEVRGFAKLLRVIAEMVVERDQLTNELRQNTRHREEFVLQTLRQTDAKSQQELRTWARRLGIDIGLTRAAVICRLTAPFERPEDELQDFESIQQFLLHEESNILTARTSREEVVVFVTLEQTDNNWSPIAGVAERAIQRLSSLLARCTKAKYSLSLGIALTGIEGLYQSWESARATMRVGQRLDPEVIKYSYYDFRLPVLLSGLAESWQATQLMVPLSRINQSQRGSESFLDTLRAWYTNNGHPGATAEALGIHRNTLDYRIRKISDATGLDLSTFDGRVLLYIALQLAEFQRDTSLDACCYTSSHYRN